jgi:hypothetical protein
MMRKLFLLALAGVTVGAFVSPKAEAIVLSGATYYTSNLNGQFTGGGWWDTVAGNVTWDIFFYKDGTLLNPGTTLSHNMAVGTYDLVFFLNDHRGHAGMNLYFDGSTSAAIAVHAPTGGAFSMTAAGTPTFGILQGSEAAPGSLSYTSGGKTVTLLNFNHIPWNDVVSPYSPTPSGGGTDTRGVLTFRVTEDSGNPVIPGPAAALPFLAGLAAARRKKK